MSAVQDNDTMMVDWSAGSDVGHLPQAVDTWIIQGDKIARYTTWFKWIAQVSMLGKEMQP